VPHREGEFFFRCVWPWGQEPPGGFGGELQQIAVHNNSRVFERHASPRVSEDIADVLDQRELGPDFLLDDAKRRGRA
jgi:hypothetical protein